MKYMKSTRTSGKPAGVLVFLRKSTYPKRDACKERRFVVR